MKKALSLGLPLLSLFAIGIAGCEDTSSNPATPPTQAEGGFGVDGGGGGGDADAPVPSKCPEPTGAPVEHNKDINADETWAAGLHDVTFDISVRKNATLTIAPCAVVRTVAARGFQVGSFNAGDGGKMVAKGQADLPIVFQGKDGARWTSLQVNSQGVVDLAHVTIKDAGSTSSRGGAALHLVADGTKPLQPLATVDHVTLEGALKYGAVLEAHAGFTAASRDLIVKGSGDMAMRVGGVAVSTIPTGSYTGNTNDAFRFTASAFVDYIDADTTVHDRGIPYVLGGEGQFPELSVNGKDGTAPLLTIEAGVVLKFSKQASGSSGLFVERASTTVAARGAIRAVGTATKPIVFTSNETTPAPGDWVGISLRGVPDPRTRIDFARIEYAGANTGTQGFSCGTPLRPDPLSNEAAIAIYGEPSSAFVTNTVILKSAANGIERAWTGAVLDFLASNTFTDITYCRQTFPKPTAGACADPAPCD